MQYHLDIVFEATWKDQVSYCFLVYVAFIHITAEIYQQLLVITQDPKETAMNILIRLMDTRQKILLACKEEDEMN